MLKLEYQLGRDILSPERRPPTISGVQGRYYVHNAFAVRYV